MSIERFWAKVEKLGADECWPWKACVDKDGYGQIKIRSSGIRSKQIAAHRYSWMIKNGEIPKGLQILHECDNPSCVNPKHLFIGTNLDNIADRVSKGRSVMGENHPRAKLKVDEVVEIRKAWDSGISQRELAARFDVPASDISSIIRNKSWKQVGIVSKRNHSGGEYHPQSKLTNENVFEIRSLRSTGLTLRKIAARFNVSISRISLIARGLQWKHLLT